VYGNAPGALQYVCTEEKPDIAEYHSHWASVGISPLDSLVDCTGFIGEHVSIITSANQNLLIPQVPDEEMVDCMGKFPVDVAAMWDTRIGESELEDCFRLKLLGWEMRSVDSYFGLVGDAIKVVVL